MSAPRVPPQCKHILYCCCSDVIVVWDMADDWSVHLTLRLSFCEGLADLIYVTVWQFKNHFFFLQMITFILLSTLISFFPLNLPSIKHLSPVVHLWETTNKWGKLKRQSYGNKAPPTQNIPRLVSNPQVVLCCALIILKRLENHGKHLLIMTLDTLDHYESHLFGHLLQGNRKTPVCMHYRSRELLQIPLCVCALGGQFSSK